MRRNDNLRRGFLYSVLYLFSGTVIMIQERCMQKHHYALVIHAIVAIYVVTKTGLAGLFYIAWDDITYIVSYQESLHGRILENGHLIAIL
jgi:hypothetical protein